MDSIFTVYTATFIAIYVILLTVFVQALIASIAHRKQKSYVPGIIDPNLGPESFVFRSHRMHINSLENVPFMVALIMLAIFMGYGATPLMWFAWAFALSRIAQTITYYSVATRKNPSLRSYFYSISLITQLILFIELGRFLVL